MTTRENLLAFGDNLTILRDHIADESVDLVYLDPPFNSDANYNMLFKEQDGSRAASQIKAFEDTWRWDAGAARAFDDVVSRGGRLADAMNALRTLVGDSDMLAYLAMMAPRLVELHRVLRDTGSLYLHCDSNASHYLKLLLDTVFGADRFVNELVWQRTSSHNDPRRYGRVHDVLLFYTKSDTYTWIPQFDPPDEDYFKAHDFEVDEAGRRYRKRDLTAPYRGGNSGQYVWRGKHPPSGRMWSYARENMERLEQEGRIVYTRTGMPRLKIFVKDLKGVPYQDVWVRPDLWLNAAARERLGYPTQKPVALLERVIRVSSRPGEVVLDPFCGCGTAVDAAERLGRAWIGVDISELAINVIRDRLKKRYLGVSYRELGEPTTSKDAHALASRDKRGFQSWVIRRLNAQPGAVGADKGIDGRLRFRDPGVGATHHVIISVKGGKVQASHLRDLRGTMARERASIGVFVTARPLSSAMRAEVASAGYVATALGRYPVLQVLTIEDLFAGRRVEYPRTEGAEATFESPKRAKRQRDAEQPSFMDSLDGTALGRHRESKPTARKKGTTPKSTVKPARKAARKRA